MRSARIAAMLSALLLISCGGDDAPSTDDGGSDASSSDAATDADSLDAAADTGDPRPGDGGTLTCEEADGMLGEALARIWSDPNACTVDGDCRLADVLFECPSGAHFAFCPVAIHVSSSSAFSAALGQSLDETCGDIPADCRGGASCVETRALCSGGACTSELASPP